MTSRRIHEVLRLMIVDGELAVGTQFPTATYFAERVGASKPTVTKAYRSLLDEGFALVKGRRLFVSRPARPADESAVSAPAKGRRRKASAPGRSAGQKAPRRAR
jgi:DNA-binding GntR family transcriptional regulator